MSAAHRRAVRLLPALLLSIMIAVAVALELTVLRPALASSGHGLMQLWLARTPIVVLLALPWLLPRRGR